MNYPLTELNCIGGERYNIVFLVVDSLRYDMIKPEIMPNVTVFLKTQSTSRITFRWYQYKTWNFYSFYRNSRLLLGKIKIFKIGISFNQALQQSGYEIGLFTSAPLTMPEFNQTIFASLPNPRSVPTVTNSIEKDENAIKDMEEWLKKLPSKTPFFAFSFS